MAQMPIEVISIGNIPTEQFEGVIAVANEVQAEFVFGQLKRDEANAFRVLAFKQASVKDFMDKMESTRIDIGGYHPFMIATVDTKLEGKEYSNLFGSNRAEKGIAIFTIDNVDGIILPKEKISAYILYYFARYTLSFIVPQHKNHIESKDCVFDRKVYKPDIIKSMKARAICDECRNKLLSDSPKVSPSQLDALDKLFELCGKILEGKEVLASRVNLSSKDRLLSELTKIKSNLDANAHNIAQRGLWLYLLFLICVWVTLAFLTYKIGWNIMEPWTYFIGGTVTLGGYLYFVATKKELSPMTIYHQLIESRKQRNYREFGFDIELYESLLAKQNSNSKTAG